MSPDGRMCISDTLCGLRMVHFKSSQYVWLYTPWGRNFFKGSRGIRAWTHSVWTSSSKLSKTQRNHSVCARSNYQRHSSVMKHEPFHCSRNCTHLGISLVICFIKKKTFTRLNDKQFRGSFTPREPRSDVMFSVTLEITSFFFDDSPDTLKHTQSSVLDLDQHLAWWEPGASDMQLRRPDEQI